MLPGLCAYLRKMFELEECAGISHSLIQINAEVCVLIRPLQRWVMDYWVCSLLELYAFLWLFPVAFRMTHTDVRRVFYGPRHRNPQRAYLCARTRTRSHPFLISISTPCQHMHYAHMPHIDSLSLCLSLSLSLSHTHTHTVYTLFTQILYCGEVALALMLNSLKLT